MFKRKIETAALLLCLAPAAWASGPGTAAADFLRIPVGARETALGGAMTAHSADADAVFYNPAGLAAGRGMQASYAYNNYFSGISQQWLAGALPYGGGTLGLGLNYFSVSPFAAYDNDNARTGSVSAYGLAAYLGYGRALRTGLALLPELRWGAAAKYISEKLDSYGASGYGLDAGLQAGTALKGLSVGLAAENLAASRLDFVASGERPERSLKAGAAYELGATGSAVTALFAADMNFPGDGGSYVSAGAEGVFYGVVSLRAGYSAYGDLSNGMSFGAGVSLPGRWKGVRLDYSYGSTYDLGSVHKFGASWTFGAPARASGKARHAAPAKAAAPAPAAADGDADFRDRVDALYNGTPEESMLAAEYLAGLDDARVDEHFISLLSSPDVSRRQSAVRGLSLRKGSRSMEGLATALGDQLPEIRRAAAAAIGARGDASYAPQLEEALKRETSDQVKSAIIESLGKLRGGTD